MSSSRPVTATIWVGNLPFETTEAELNTLLSTVGPIKNLRLIIDRETGRPKGFGFCEFYNKDVAESAYRNLNNTEFRGRTIRIDFAEENMSDRKGRGAGGGGDGGRDAGPGGPRPPLIGYHAAANSAKEVKNLLGGAPSSDTRVQEQLNELLASRSKPELWEVLRLLKEFLGGDRNAAKQYFAERPGLTKAVFQAQVLLGMVKPLGAAFPAQGGFPEGPIGIPGRLGGPPPPPPRSAGGPLGLQVPPGAVLPPGGPMTQVVVVDPTSGQPQTVMVPAGQLNALGVVQPPPVQPGMIQPGGPVALPPQPEGLIAIPQQPVQQMQVPQAVPVPQQPAVVQQPQQPPPAAPQQQQPPPQPASGGVAAAFSGQDPQQMQTLLRQVVTMTDEQINALPEQFKQQVLFVKEQIRLGNVRVE